MKKLPKLYTNSFDKKIDNSIDYVKVDNTIEKKEKLNKFDINKKIDYLFKSNNYIYKIKVEIFLINDTIKCYIIGKTKNNLITIDNKLININNILDIKKID